MPKHRLERTRRVRSTFTAVAVAVASGAGVVALAGPASAAATWYVATTGADNAACGTAPATPCKTPAYAIAKAAFASGDTINVSPGVYPATLINGLTGKSATIIGSGAGVVFDGGGTSWAIGVNAVGVTVDLRNLTLRNGGWTAGGALPLVNGTVHATDVDVTGSRSPIGGGVYVGPGAKLTWNGGTFSGNTATAANLLQGAGGALYVAGRVTGTTPVAAGSASLDGVTFTGNLATGGTYAATGNGGAVFNAGATTISGSSFTGNRVVAGTSTASPRRGQGGAVFNGPNDTDDDPVLTVSTSSFQAGSGSGVHALYGGALANGESNGGPVPHLTATDVDVDGTSANLGGAVFNGGDLTWHGGSIAHGLAYAGGGVYNMPTTAAQATNTVARFDGTGFSSNTANSLNVANLGLGGAIFNAATLRVDSADFDDNAAVASSTTSAATGYGAAIWNGAYATTFRPDLTVSDSEFRGGQAAVGGAIANAGNVFNVAGSPAAVLTADGLNVHDNQALAGGGIYTGGESDLTGGRIHGNRATHASVGYGGGLYVTRAGSDPAPVVHLTGVDVDDNSATVLGGGIAAMGHTEVHLTDGAHLDANSSDYSGGGAYNAGALTVADSSVSGNQAGYQGGGLYNGSTVSSDAPSVTLTDSAADDNTAANAGGAALTLGANSSFSVDGGHLNGNTAYAGGAVFVGDATGARFDGTELHDNTATVLGGGAIVNAGRVDIDSSTLTGNHAVHTSATTGLGGAIYSGTNTAGATTRLTVRHSLIAGNDAYAASAILTYSPGSGTTNQTVVDSSTITGNASSSVIGAVEQLHPMTITSSTITGNTAAEGGTGGLGLYAPTTASISGSIVADNSGHDCSGTPVDGGYNLAAPGDASCGFGATRHDVVGAPGLGALADNGGSTDTLLPDAASPALDVVPVETATGVSDAIDGEPVVLCAAGQTDQRGIARPQGTRCDIGAVEADQSGPTVSGPAQVELAVGNQAAPAIFTTTGSPQPTLSVVGNLPAGITFVDNNDGTGTLAGTPGAHAGGRYDVVVRATNEAGSADAEVTVIVGQAPALTGPGAATYRVGEAGEPVTFTQSEGYPDADVSIDGALPAGVAFDGGAGAGTLHGTPQPGTGGVYPLTVRATGGTQPDAALPFELTVTEASGLTGPPSSTFVAGTAGTSAAFIATGYPAPTISASGLPAGLGLSGTGHATISGTPESGTGGEYDVVVTASNGVDDDATLSTHVVVDEAPSLSGPTSATFVVGDFSQIGYGAVGYPEAQVTFAGTLPAGLSFVPGSGGGLIKGTPAAGTVGNYAITVRAHNGVDADSVVHLTLEVAPTVSVSTTSLPGGTVGSAYGAQLSATGGQPLYSYDLASGSLPSGLTLAATGQITGTPTGPSGITTFTVRVTDSATGHHTATKQLSITIGKGATSIVAEPLVLRVSTLTLSTITVLKARLSGGSPARGVGGQTLVFRAGKATICTAVTAADGSVACQLNLTGTLLALLSGGYTVEYAGSDRWSPTTGAAAIISM